MKLPGRGGAATLLLAIAVLAGCATTPTVPPAARPELAPGGKLRVGLLVTNAVFVSKDGPSGEMQGVAVELGRALAKQLGVPFEPVRYDAIAKLVDGVKSREWDIAFMGFEQGRTAVVDFSAPYLELGSTYLVPTGSPIKAIGDIDKPGQRIGTANRSAQERYLSGSLKQAQLVRYSGGTNKDGLQLLSSGKIDALAGNGLTLLQISEKVPGFRVLEGQFAPVLHTLAVPKGKPAGAAYAREFIEHAKASGMVQQAIDRASLRGVKVAAPAQSK